MPGWQNGSYYDYGWIVPPLVLLFIFNRVKSLPSEVSGESIVVSKWVIGLAVLLLLCLIPVRVFQTVDARWRFPNWVHTGVVLSTTAVSLALVFRWEVVKAVVPGTLFILLAIPLPTFVEGPFVEGLTNLVVQLTSAILPIVGYPAKVVGSSFIVNNEVFDVGEGCSGIRSFQSCVMASLALGELYRLSAAKRVGLLLSSLLLAITVNAVRVVVLVRGAFDRGSEGMKAYHDSVGVWATIITYLAIGLMAWAFCALNLRLIFGLERTPKNSKND